MKSLAILLSLFIALGQGNGQSSSIIMSSIGPQEVYEEARITVYFSTLKYFESIEFSSDDLPAFGTLLNDGAGSGRFIFDPTHADIGRYAVTLDAESGNLSSRSIFSLEVVQLPDDARVFYVDPENGDSDNPGTAAEPFASMALVLINNLSQIEGNTFFYLRSGLHNSPVFVGSHDSPVHVLAERNHTPAAKKISFSFTTNWYVSGLEISPEAANEVNNANLVTVFAGSKDIVLTNCKIFSIDDASVWTTNQEWYDGCGNGIISSGTDCLYKNNFLKNTWFSVELRKESSEFSYNIIDWFGADAIRALANHQRIKYNQIKNATVFDYDHPTRPQHDDGIQSWTFNLPVKDMHIIGNQIADITDPDLPLPTEFLQGIVDFDGFAEDWIVENNLVVTHHAHGIALFGAKNCKVSNNTVVRNPFNLFTPNFKPWIRINPRKPEVGGDLSTGNLIRNNIMATYEDENKEPGTQDHNTTGTNYSNIFEDYMGWDFHLSENSPAVNAGSDENAPGADLEQKRRDTDNIDAGCFERAAVLSDIEPPSLAGNIITSQATESSITLEWDDSQDNTGVAHYEVTIDDGQTLRTSEATVFISGLEPESEYVIRIRAFDHFGNMSSEVTYAESTASLAMMSIHFIPAHGHDQMIKSNARLMWVGAPHHRVGGYFGQNDASAVLPFRLPCLDENRMIVSADLTVFLNSTVNAPDGNIDVYGLDHRPLSDVLATDHWQGPYGNAPSGTPIAEGFMTSETPQGLVKLPGDTETNLGAYLQGLYDNGAGCQDYALLRLNIGADQEKDNAYYEMNSADSDNSFNIPLLKIITNGPTAVKPLEIKNGITVSPNPNAGDMITLQIEGFKTERAQIVIHDGRGMEVFRKKVENIGKEASLNIKPDLVSGIYFITILGNNRYAQRKLMVM